MVSFEEAADMLDSIANEFPEDFYKELNGGINILPDIKYHPEGGKSGDLYILGEYFRDTNGLGRYINIYFGSFVRVYGHLDADSQRLELKKTLAHEFTHHIESLAGEYGLEIKDHINIEKYKKNKR